MINIVSFSGGKDSTAMLLKMIDMRYEIDDIIFVDTTKEFESMYVHINKVEKYINRKITRLKIDFDYWFHKHIKTRGKNKGKIGYGWPDFKNRWCTALKRDSIKKHLKGIKHVQYHGIAYDEQHRAKQDINIKYPLIDFKMSEKDCLNYCYNLGFDWNGLYRKFSRVSCYCCPLKKIKELKIIYNEFPILWNKMVVLDKKSFRKFRNDYSLIELERKFKDKKE